MGNQRDNTGRINPGRSVGSASPESPIAGDISMSAEVEDVEGLDDSSTWGDYPLDEICIRHESRTVDEVMRRIDSGQYIVHTDFQRDFVWSIEKQSKLIESAVMRIPLPVFYFAQNKDGYHVVVDGLQRLNTLCTFVADKMRLDLPSREELDKKLCSELLPVHRNRIYDCNLEVYIIDHKVPERARLDIFERVNGGEQLTRQQMRNSLYNGRATNFLRNEAQSKEFQEATCGSLSQRTMRDRELINRFCAFHVLGPDEYRGDMDIFLADSLRVMNVGDDEFEEKLRAHFRRGLRNNIQLFGKHAFRRNKYGQEKHSMINVALWDVMSTELSKREEYEIVAKQEQLRSEIGTLLMNEDFRDAISKNPGAKKQVKKRFEMARSAVSGVLNDN